PVERIVMIRRPLHGTGRGFVSGAIAALLALSSAGVLAAEPDHVMDPTCAWGRLSDGRGKLLRCLTREEAARLGRAPRGPPAPPAGGPAGGPRRVGPAPAGPGGGGPGGGGRRGGVPGRARLRARAGRERRGAPAERARRRDRLRRRRRRHPPR